MRGHITKRVAKAIALVAISTATLYGGGANFNKKNIEISRTIIGSSSDSSKIYEVSIDNNSNFALKNYTLKDGDENLKCQNSSAIVMPGETLFCRSSKSVDKAQISQNKSIFTATAYSLVDKKNIDIQNGDFESGTLEGWKSSGDVDIDTTSDSSKALIQRESILTKYIKVDKADNYSVSVLVKSNEANTKASLSVMYLDRDKNPLLSASASKVIESTDGKEAIYRLVLPKSENASYIQFDAYVDEGSILVDNLKANSITIGKSAEKVKVESGANSLKALSALSQSNYNSQFSKNSKLLNGARGTASLSCPSGYTSVSIINPSFEKGSSGYNIYGWRGGVVYLANCCPGYCGTRFAVMTKGHTLKQSFSVKPNTKYIVKFKAGTDSKGFHGQRVTIYDNKGKSNSVYIKSVGLQAYSLPITTSNSATSVTIKIEARSGCYIMFDCFEVCKAPAYKPDIDIEKSTNGQDADTGTGPKLLLGSTVTWKYVVKNTGKVNLNEVEVSDNREGKICNIGNLSVGQTKICTKVGKVTKIGQYSNIATVIGYGAGKKVTDTDPSHYKGVPIPYDSKIDIEKHTNGKDSDATPGENLKVGSKVTWEYIVTNNGNSILKEVEVRDNVEGKISCPKNTLKPSENMICKKEGIVKLGKYANSGTVIAKDPNGKKVTDTDQSHYNGVKVENASIGDRVWYDVNQNGIQDSNERGIQGIRIHLYKNGKDTGKLTYTDKNGNYIFDNLTAGNYQIKVDKPKNYPYFTLQNAGSDDAKDSDVSPINGLSDTIKLASNQHYKDADAGLVCGACARIDVEKYTNNQDADTGTGPVIITGKKVTWKYVVKNIGNVVLNDIVLKDNKEGKISCPKTTLQAGESMTCKKEGIAKAGQYANEATVTGKPPVAHAVSDKDPSHYYGKATSCIGNFVWNDLNFNGIQNSGESGVAGAKVQLLYSNGEVAKDINGNPVTPQTTKADGKYKFCNLDKGSYIVKVTPPSGYLVSPQNQGSNDNIDSDINPSNGKTALIALPEGVNDMKWDAGLLKANPKIDIEKSTNNQDADKGTGPVLAVGSKVTWRYVVKNIGNLKLQDIVVNDNKEGKISCPKTTLNPNESMSCSKEGVVKAGQYANEATVTGKDVTGKSVSDKDPSHYYGKTPSCLGNFVWFDKNANGIQDVRESGISGVKVELLTSNGQPVKDVNGNTVAPQTTSANGEYKFCNLDKGSYIVKVTPPSGYLVSPQNQGGDDTKDSDINPSNGQTTTINLAEGANDMKWDAGLYKTSCIGDYVWVDYDGDGIQGTDSRESGLAGVVVTLLDENGNSVKDINGNAISPQTTGADGKYQFCNLKPGKYKVKMVENDPYYYVTYKNRGNDESKDSDLDETTLTTDVVNLDAGVNYKDLDGGYFKCGSLIGVYSIIPMNGMSALSADSGILDGLTVTIYDENGKVVKKVTTDRAGNFRVDNLKPGKYKVVFEGVEGAKFATPKEVNITVKPGSKITIEPAIVSADADDTKVKEELDKQNKEFVKVEASSASNNSTNSSSEQNSDSASALNTITFVGFIFTILLLVRREERS